MTIENLVIRKCDIRASSLNEARIISIEKCPQNFLSLRVTMRNVHFVKNRSNGAAFFVDKADCYELVLQDVLLASNSLGQSCQMSKRNKIIRLQLIKNRCSSCNSAILTTPDNESYTEIVQLNASKNNQPLILAKKNATVSINDSSIQKNFCSDQSIINGTNATLEINDSKFRSNECKPRYGGIITLSSGHLSVDNSIFIDNRGVTGGAIFTDASSFDISKSVFEENTAEIGGSLFSYMLPNSSFGSSIKRTSFTRNNATSYGGAISIVTSNAIEVSILSNSFKENNAPRGGKS